MQLPRCTRCRASVKPCYVVLYKLSGRDKGPKRRNSKFLLTSPSQLSRDQQKRLVRRRLSRPGERAERRGTAAVTALDLSRIQIALLHRQ